MAEQEKFLLVAVEALPEVFGKVMQAKLLLTRGKAKNASQAARMADISRSAFYKYKDSVFLYDERMQQNIVNFYMTLEDRPGVLSTLLSKLYDVGANVVTVNQSIPLDGVAVVSVSVRTLDSGCSKEEILKLLDTLDGVVDARCI